jgi:serine/threonine protein kinase
MDSGRHSNIVHIWAHGWLRGSGGLYFIDMDLGEFTLGAYIKYLHHDGSSRPKINPNVMKSGVCVREDSNTRRAHNLWVIGGHIAGGLQFLHQQGQVHRDLKPNNSLSRFKALLSVVLYFAKEDAWKLTDFGISAEATSNMISTSLSRGTGGYRAPELLKEDPKFGRSVDIWALGCVLYEVAMGKKPFADDWAVFHHATGTSDPTPVVQGGPEFYQHHLNGVLGELLSRQPQKRPKISSICSTFHSYSRVFGLEPIQQLYGSSVFPSYQEWKEMSNSDQTKWCIRIAKDLLGAGDRNSAISWFIEMTRSSDKERRLQELNPRVLQEPEQSLLFEAVDLFQAAIEAYPTKFDLQRMLAEYCAGVVYGVTTTSEHRAMTKALNVLNTMFIIALASGAVSNPRLLYRELSIVYLEAGLTPPVLSAEQEELVYPWTAFGMSHNYVLHGEYPRALDVHRDVLESRMTDWRRLVSDLVEHFENRLQETSQTDSRDDDEFKLYNPVRRLVMIGNYKPSLRSQ